MPIYQHFRDFVRYLNSAIHALIFCCQNVATHIIANPRKLTTHFECYASKSQFPLINHITWCQHHVIWSLRKNLIENRLSPANRNLQFDCFCSNGRVNIFIQYAPTNVLIKTNNGKPHFYLSLYLVF